MGPEPSDDPRSSATIGEPSAPTRRGQPAPFMTSARSTMLHDKPLAVARAANMRAYRFNSFDSFENLDQLRLREEVDPSLQSVEALVRVRIPEIRPEPPC